jgi:hypothetical protein
MRRNSFVFTLTSNSSDDECYDNIVARLHCGVTDLVSTVSAQGASVLNAVVGRLMKLDWGLQLLLLVMQQEVENVMLGFVWVRGN